MRFVGLKVSVALLTATALASTDTGWKYVEPGIFRGISGAALQSSNDTSFTFLVVFDNKKKNESDKKPESFGRAGLLTVTRDGWPKLNVLDWPDTEQMPRPNDLECLTSIPGRAGEYLAMTSKGETYRISLDASGTSVVVKETFQMPNLTKTSEAEGLSVQEVDGDLIAVYGDRGKSPTAGTFYFTTLDRTTLKPASAVQTASLKAPWPDIELTRAISDLKLEPSGALFVTWAWETDNDNGPFASGLTCAGTLNKDGGTLKFRPGAATRLLTTNSRKIEALELVPGAHGGFFLGTDDENFGSSIYYNFWE